MHTLITSEIASGFFPSWATREAQEYCSGQPIPSPEDLSDPGIKPESPALKADSLPAELPGKPPILYNIERNKDFRKANQDTFNN